MANVAFKTKARKSAGSVREAKRRSVDEKIGRAYEAFRRTDTKVLSPNGDARRLPASPSLFLTELLAQLDRNRSVTIVRDQAVLTTMEAANMLGVSRQFLVNLLEDGEIAHHRVGTHRRIYAEDLLRYKTARDKSRHKRLRSLSAAEAAEGLYEHIPLHPDAG